MRFELGAYALDPSIQMVVPWRQKKFFERFPGRNELLEYARQHGIPVEATTKKPYSMDENLFHISYESGVLEDPWAAPPEDMFRMTTDPTKARRVRMPGRPDARVRTGPGYGRGPAD